MKRPVLVVTRARTMSGRRGGCRLTLEHGTAMDWIARGWCDPVVDEPRVEKQQAKTDERKTA